MDKQLKRYTRLKNSYTNFTKLSKDLRTKGACLIRIEQVQKLWIEFDSEHDKLLEDEEIDEKDQYFVNDVYSSAEECYLSNLDRYQDFLLTCQQQENQHNLDRPAVGNALEAMEINRSKLPEIELETFDGDVKQWVRFRDKFIEMIVRRPNLPNVFKMHYLTTFLTGEAADLIEEISPSGDNFDSAWEIVRKHYDNNRLLITKSISKLLTIEPMTSDSAHEIARIRNKTRNILQSLKSLGSPVDHWDHITVFLTNSRLTQHLQDKWEEQIAKSASPQELPTQTQLDNFLESERLSAAQKESTKEFVAFGESSSAPKPKEKTFNAPQPNYSKTSNFKSFNDSQNKPQTKEDKTGLCVLCKNAHKIANCPIFESKNSYERKEIITKNRLCFNCFGPHPIIACDSRYTCRECAGKHHTKLHFPHTNSSLKPEAKDFKPNVVLNSSLSQTVEAQLANTDNIPQNTMLISTARIHVFAKNGRNVLIRALVDQCAQASFIDTEMCQLLKLETRAVYTPVDGIADTNIVAKYITEFTLKPHFNSPFEYKVEAYVLPKITSYEPFTGANTHWTHLTNINLADPDYTESGKIHVLLGTAVHARILLEGLRKDNNVEAPIAVKSELGWLISGPSTPDAKPSRPSVNMQLTEQDNLNGELRKFWELEEMPEKQHLTAEETLCEELYKATVRRTDNKYVVRLPLKDNTPTNWKNSYDIAYSRMLSLEKKFEKEPQYRSDYITAINEMIDTGTLRKVSKADINVKNCYFLPHHGVVKESSTSTKLRPVFNASTKNIDGHSLNDFLMIGPNLLPEMTTTITNWRRYPIAFASDVPKMFLKIKVALDLQHLQAIIWRESPNDEMQIYFLTTVTFGFASSSFLASRTLKQLAQDEQKMYPLAAKILEKETYMDDILSGDFTVEGAELKNAQLSGMLRQGDFEVHKFMSNSKELLRKLPTEMIAKKSSLKVGTGFAVLGIAWDPQKDNFYYNVNTESYPSHSGVITRRSVLSRVAKIFDPPGWIAPIVIVLKIFMQKLWLITREWDEPLPVEEAEFWRSSYNSLQNLSKIRISRWIGTDQSQQIYEIHGFADASKLAYACVIYLRIISNESKVYLLTAKTKVAPIKTVSVPRLELCAAQMLARLVKHTADNIELENFTVHLWSDSKDVLYWLKGTPSRWPTFVANRCADIVTQLPNAYWHHINSSENPADLASRGCSVEELLKHDLWWHGPHKLKDTTENWPRSNDLDHEATEKIVTYEVEPTTTINTVVLTNVNRTKNNLWVLIENHSSLSKLVRIVIYVMRFVRKILPTSLKNPVSQTLLDFPLSTRREVSGIEVRQAKLILAHLTQSHHFSNELSLLQQNQPLPKNHKLKCLNPILKDGLIRVGGRIKHSLLSEDEKFPIILPKDSKLTSLIVSYYHHLTMHGGTQLTLMCIRRMFWILKGKLVVKSLILKCISCTRYKAFQYTQKMGDLPPERVRPSKPFTVTGVDYAGPYLLKTSKHRGNKSYKGYLVIFICFSTKAVHLEVVSGYDSQSFIACFQRLVARRGACKKLVSDQGTNFVGADSELRQMYSENSDFVNVTGNELANQHGVVWEFNPPGAPHFGGLWEAAVKSVKHHLKRTVGDLIMTYEEFATLLVQVEAILNSRPLVPLNEDSSDSFVLTPAHFLIGESSMLISDPRIVKEKITPLERWKRVTRYTQQLWDCWSSAYLVTLQKRNKWKDEQPSFKVNDIVLIKGENTAPTHWPLAKITKVFPGDDGLVRVAALRTATTTLLRPIVKLVKLLDGEETQDEADNQNGQEAQEH